MLRSFCYCYCCCQPVILHHPCHSLDFSQNLLLSNVAIICGPPRGSFAAQYEDPLRSCVHHQAPNCQRSNAHVKSGLVKGRNALYIRFLVPARILYNDVGETWRLFQTKKKHHMDKVRLTNEDLHKGNTLSAEKRTGKEDGGLARYTMEWKWCWLGKRGDRTKRESTGEELKQRKVLEGIESLRQRHCRMRVLNSFHYVETWKTILKSFFDLEKDCRRRWVITKSKSTWQASDYISRAFWHLHVV